jgi:hypothetical protein
MRIPFWRSSKPSSSSTPLWSGSPPFPPSSSSGEPRLPPPDRTSNVERSRSVVLLARSVSETFGRLPWKSLSLKNQSYFWRTSSHFEANSEPPVESSQFIRTPADRLGSRSLMPCCVRATFPWGGPGWHAEAHRLKDPPEAKTSYPLPSQKHESFSIM